MLTPNGQLNRPHKFHNVCRSICKETDSSKLAGQTEAPDCPVVFHRVADMLLSNNILVITALAGGDIHISGEHANVSVPLCKSQLPVQSKLLPDDGKSFVALRNNFRWTSLKRCDKQTPPVYSDVRYPDL